MFTDILNVHYFLEIREYTSDEIEFFVQNKLLIATTAMYAIYYSSSSKPSLINFSSKLCPPNKPVIQILFLLSAYTGGVILRSVIGYAFMAYTGIVVPLQLRVYTVVNTILEYGPR